MNAFVPNDRCRVLSPEDVEARIPAVGLPASQALPIPDLNILLVLLPSGELSVYSGIVKVCLKIHCLVL